MTFSRGFSARVPGRQQPQRFWSEATTPRSAAMFLGDRPRSVEGSARSARPGRADQAGRRRGLRRRPNRAASRSRAGGVYRSLSRRRRGRWPGRPREDPVRRPGRPGVRPSRPRPRGNSSPANGSWKTDDPELTRNRRAPLTKVPAHRLVTDLDVIDLGPSSGQPLAIEGHDRRPGSPRFRPSADAPLEPPPIGTRRPSRRLPRSQMRPPGRDDLSPSRVPGPRSRAGPRWSPEAC